MRACIHDLFFFFFYFVAVSTPPTVRADRAVHSTLDDDVDVMNFIGSCQCWYSIMEWTSVSHSILI